MGKKLLALFLALCLGCSLLPSAAFAAGEVSVGTQAYENLKTFPVQFRNGFGWGSRFNDADPDAYYASAVDWAVSKGITNGTGPNRFSPHGTCTRAQTVTFLYRVCK